MNLSDAEIRTALPLRHSPKARPPKSRGLKVASPAAIHFTPKFAPESKNPCETTWFDFSFPTGYGPVRCGKIFGQGKLSVWQGLSGAVFRSALNAEHGCWQLGDRVRQFPRRKYPGNPGDSSAGHTICVRSYIGQGGDRQCGSFHV